MGIQTQITATCDLKGCTSGQGSVGVVQWIQELVESGKTPMPELAQYLVILIHNNVKKTFCCQLHAAEYFLPPGYEAKQKQVIEVPKKVDVPETTLPWLVRKPVVESESWMDEPLRHEQPDGYSESPDNGQEGA